jgi:hypothetical protein
MIFISFTTAANLWQVFRFIISTVTVTVTVIRPGRRFAGNLTLRQAHGLGHAMKLNFRIMIS